MKRDIKKIVVLGSTNTDLAMFMLFIAGLGAIIAAGT